MLSQKQLKLLTANVDGETDNRQRRALRRLLNESPQARSVLRDLQDAARMLRDLPGHKLGEDFAAQVLEALLPPGRPPARCKGLNESIPESGKCNALLPEGAKRPAGPGGSTWKTATLDQ